jgi:bleomycin hydrolase
MILSLRLGVRWFKVNFTYIYKMKRKANPKDNECFKKIKETLSDNLNVEIDLDKFKGVDSLNGITQVLIEQLRDDVVPFSKIKEWQEEFKSNPTKAIIRNAVVSVGAIYSSTDSEAAKKIDHVFEYITRRRGVKATDQGNSGRCWMFAGLNVFRHTLMDIFGIDQFEYSQTHLFFWDKFERSNIYLQWFIDNHLPLNDRYNDDIIKETMCDGGYWNYFANLVEKYGLVPKSAMPETFQSDYSSDLNDIIEERLRAGASYIYNNYDKLSKEELKTIKFDVLHQIYDTLVKFLGEPPINFDWSFVSNKTEDGEDLTTTVKQLTPFQFKDLAIPNVCLHDYVVLSNVPGYKYYQLYEVENRSNVSEGQPCQIVNLPIAELKKFSKKVIKGGMGVWFAGEVGRGFSWQHGCLNNQIVNSDLTFGELYPPQQENKKSHPFDKQQRIMFNDVGPSHAMVLSGINVNSNDRPISWSVENSWGYFDKDVLGEDGWLTMSDNWFSENLIQVAIHRQFLSRNILKILDQQPIVLKPWDFMAPALKVGPTFIPRNKPKPRKRFL